MRKEHAISTTTESTLAPKQQSPVLLIILIVLWMLGLLAFLFMAFATKIVLPRMVRDGRQAHEATLKANIKQIRGAIDRFHTDTGSYPVTLTDMALPENVAPKDGINAGGDHTHLPAGSYQGPYLTATDGIGGVPANPFNKSIESDIAGHWSYRNGVVHPAGPVGNTLDSTPYSEL